jgi:hypothetical protein
MSSQSQNPHDASPGAAILTGARRTLAMGALAAALLVVGGSAVALAADPAASPDPSATTLPADDGTTSPDPTTAPDVGTPGTGRHAHGDCPAKDGADTGAAPSSGTTLPAPDVTTPAPSVDPSSV